MNIGSKAYFAKPRFCAFARVPVADVKNNLTATYGKNPNNLRAKGQPQEGKTRQRVPLVVTKDFVGHFSKTSLKKGGGPSRFKLQRYATSLTSHGGLSSCMWLMAFGAIGVQVKGKPIEAGSFDKTRLGSLAVCGSHLCPVCGPRVASQRTDEVKAILDKSNKEGLFPVMITLTLRHQSGDHLAVLMTAMKAALRRWKQHRKYKDAKPSIVGVISATETTHGGSGWHPHFHLIMLVKADSKTKALRLVATLRKPWQAALESEGRDCGRAGFKATMAESASKYVAKWDAAPEVAKAHDKKGRDKSRTPTQLLRDAYNGDKRAAGLWAIYAGVMKGKSVLRFSPGLRAWAGLLDVSDEEAATPADDTVLIDLIDGGEWEAAKAGGLSRDDLLREARKGRGAIRRYIQDCVAGALPLIEDG